MPGWIIVLLVILAVVVVAGLNYAAAKRGRGKDVDE